MSLVQNRIVVKVGTSSLTNDIGNTNLRSFDKLALVLSDVANMGYQVILVSSGAIAVGTSKMGLKTKPESMRMKQAAAAVGQCQNMFLYDKFFSEYGHTIAQILLNASDIEQEEKKENLTNTFEALLENGIIPIVNENDSVSYTEIESKDRLFGDNDMLSAVVAVLVRAEKLVIFSDIDGLYEADPRFNPQAKINAMQKVINALNENIGSLKGYKVLRGKYDTLLREKVELEYKVKELGMTVDQLNKVLEGQRDKRDENQEMLGYALMMHPDFLEWYTKEKAKNTVNSYEAQIEILKAKIATMRKDT